MARIRLLYIVSTLGRSGPTRQLYNLIKYLDRDIFEISVLTLSHDPKQNLRKKFEDLQINLIDLNLSRLGGLTVYKNKLESILQRIKPDAIHSQGFRSDWISSRLRTKTVRIATQRNYPLEDFPRLYSPVIGFAMAKLHCYALSRIPYVVACADSITDKNKQIGIQSTTIRNGVDLSNLDLSNSETKKIEQRDKLDIPRDSRLFIYAGPLIKRKNPLLLIQAFQRYKHSSNILILLGEGPLRAACQNLAESESNIFLPGFVNNVSDYLTAADFFVSASHSEGMPNAVLEALGIGLPLILSDIPSHREILDIFPRFGKTFPVGDVQILGSLFSSNVLPQLPRSEISQSLVQYFSAEIMSHSYQQLYRSEVRKDCAKKSSLR